MAVLELIGLVIKCGCGLLLMVTEVLSALLWIAALEYEICMPSSLLDSTSQVCIGNAKTESDAMVCIN